MKTLRLLVTLAIGVVYVLYTTGHPDQSWIARVLVVLALAAVWGITALVSGREAASADPVAPDPISSLNLTERVLEGESTAPNRKIPFDQQADPRE